LVSSHFDLLCLPISVCATFDRQAQVNFEMGERKGGGYRMISGK